MGFREYNPNPAKRNTVDCAVRAVSKALGQDWETTYAGLAVQGYMLNDMMEANHVWGAYLKQHGFKRYIIPDDLPDGYTVRDFAEDRPRGTYVLAVSNHVVTIVDGDWYDTWDSGNEIPIYYLSYEEVR